MYDDITEGLINSSMLIIMGLVPPAVPLLVTKPTSMIIQAAFQIGDFVVELALHADKLIFNLINSVFHGLLFIGVTS